MHDRILLFDLDCTLLQSDKRISKRTLDAVRQCRERGYLMGIATSRSEKNALLLLPGLCPDILISSSGALVNYRGTYIHREEFTVDETNAMIRLAKELCGEDHHITVDTIQGDYCSYIIKDPSFNHYIYTDFRDFHQNALRMCAELRTPGLAEVLASGIADCGWIKFLGGDWYQFAKETTTKADAVLKLCAKTGFSAGDITAFGDDLVDAEMLRLCGTGVAMGNALEEVKNAADIVIGSNDEDAIAEYLTEYML